MRATLQGHATSRCTCGVYFEKTSDLSRFRRITGQYAQYELLNVIEAATNFTKWFTSFTVSRTKSAKSLKRTATSAL